MPRQIGWEMNSDRKRTVVILIFLLTRALDTGAAESSSSLLDKFSTDSVFEHSRFETSLNSGVLLSPFVATKHRPTINYTITSLQLGYMLTDINERGWLRGNFEMLGDAFGSAVYKGPGNYVAGATLWVRYNFVQPGWRLVPYAQAGGGFVLTDIDRDVVGQEFNFNLDLGVGFRYFLGTRWSVAAEYRYQHLSNANMGKKNLGINAHGPVLGVSFFF